MNDRLKSAPAVPSRVRLLRFLILVLAACALGLLFNSINPDGIPLTRSVPSYAGR